MVQRSKSGTRPGVLMIALLFGASGCSSFGGSAIEPVEPRDADISTRIKQALVKEPSVDAAAILVGVTGEAIELSGFVETDEERATAETLARDAFPELTIENRIEVQ